MRKTQVSGIPSLSILKKLSKAAKRIPRLKQITASKWEIQDLRPSLLFGSHVAIKTERALGAVRRQASEPHSPC
jgi:hypothetical protein